MLSVSSYSTKTRRVKMDGILRKYTRAVPERTGIRRALGLTDNSTPRSRVNSVYPWPASSAAAAVARRMS